MKKAIIVGATSGIGKELAKILVQNDYVVGITGRRTEHLEELKLTNPNRFYTSTFDITQTQSVVESLEILTKQIGGLDLLIISSGMGDLNENLDFNIEKKTIETNILGFTCVVDWAFNFFKNQNKGHLVGISSVGGLRGSRVSPSYNASKAYQINYLEGLRQKVSKSKMNIKITDVRPGLVDTAMAKGEGLFWVAPVEKASQQIYQAIKKEKQVAYITKRWKLIATLLKILPRQIYNNM